MPWGYEFVIGSEIHVLLIHAEKEFEEKKVEKLW